MTLACPCCTRPICSTSPTTMNVFQQFLYRDSRQENILFSIFYSLVFVITVPGNTLALWTFTHQDSTSPSDIFLRHLSVADIFCVLILPVRVVYHLSDNRWPFGQAACRLAGFLFYLNMYCSLYLMSFISMDRFLAVVFAIRAQSVRRALYAKVGVGILWVTMIVSMSPMLFLNRGINANSSSICSKLYLEETSFTSLVSTVVAFIVPFTTIIISYVLILWKLQTVKQRHPHHDELPACIPALPCVQVGLHCATQPRPDRGVAGSSQSAHVCTDLCQWYIGPCDIFLPKSCIQKKIVSDVQNGNFMSKIVFFLDEIYAFNKNTTCMVLL